MPTVITQGAASAKGYGFGARSVAATYIEDVFSTYLYTGTGASQTISNGVDLSTKGGMVWIKSRSAATNNFLFDTSRGTTKEINSNTTDAEATLANSLTAFNTDGFTVNSATGIGVNAATYVSWTFRKQAKFFDVVTWTGNGTLPRVIPHNLGSVPGCIIAKRTDIAADWYVYHRSLNGGSVPEFYWLLLNSTVATQGSGSIWGTIAPTSTGFNVGAALNTLPGSGITPTYVAYVFAHDAGGFGAAGTDNVISCGSFTADGSGNATVSLGYEPQFVLYKYSSTTGSWRLLDMMRGWSNGGNDALLLADSSGAESSTTSQGNPTATGFEFTGGVLAPSQTAIYIAIRRGPMKTPTTGTSVFSAIAITGNGATQNVTSNFAPDALWNKTRGGGGVSYTWGIVDKLRMKGFDFTQTSGETAAVLSTFNNTGMSLIADGATNINKNGDTQINWLFRRAPGFFDVVCYTGTGSATTFNHNLGIAPELMIVKRRSATSTWRVYSNALTSAAYALTLNSTAAEASLPTVWNSTAPTSSVFSVGTSTDTNASSGTYVAYLFGTVAGVSKVGSYTGTGTTKQIDCGFTGGARFVLIKRTDSTGDWYVWDSARGIVSGNDPYLLLNSTAAEVTNTDYIDTYSAGFEISSTAPAAINANGGSFIFLAIA